ncbi:MAG: cobalamin-independent methionine synthase II family protein [Acidimicrobiales bacterium]|nr:cobalamin-independent methionine synthase II family protein [Acidimicrobiales bacterium]
MLGPPVITARSDVVGSLLRPLELLEARGRHATGRLSDAEFKAVEDQAVDAAVELQEQVGLEVVTDGEMRRLSFQSSLVDATEGCGEVPLDAFLWGEWHSDTLGSERIDRPSRLGVVGRLRARRAMAAEELTYLRARTSRVPKVTLASPSLHQNLWSGERSTAAYPTLDDFLADVVELYRREIAELARLGARYIQLDAPHYLQLVDPRWRSFHSERGSSPERWLGQAVEADNAVMTGHPEVTFGLHLCRGNQKGRWLFAGDYEPVAAHVLRTTAAQRLLLEYDDERSGGFEPLRQVPDDRMVVLGLVSTKYPRRESVAEVTSRVREASSYVDLDRLAVSPQCGFSSSVVGNPLTPADERAKLSTVVRAAASLFGES